MKGQAGCEDRAYFTCPLIYDATTSRAFGEKFIPGRSRGKSRCLHGMEKPTFLKVGFFDREMPGQTLGNNLCDSFGAYVAGTMFWFTRKKFSGSYLAFIRVRRS